MAVSFDEGVPMRRVSLARLLVVALLSFLAAGAHAQAKTFATPPDSGRAAWFLDMLKALSDVDGLSDPDKVGAILGVRFRKAVTTTSPSFDERFGKSFKRDEYVPVDKTWFIAGPPGYASTGDLGWNHPAARGDAVNFKYFQSTRHAMADRNRDIQGLVRDDSHTLLMFYGLDKLACITVQDVQVRFPGIDHMLRTDASAESYVYHPPMNQDGEIVVSFAAPRGRCMTDASAEEFSWAGKHQGRAMARFSACVEQVAASWCADYPRDELAANFNEVARKRCGALVTFDDKDPRTNVMPPSAHAYAHLLEFCPDRSR